MGRPRAARISPEVETVQKMEEKALAQANMPFVSKQVEKELQNLPPVLDTEKQKRALREYTPATNKKAEKRLSYLDHLPEGSDRSKLIVAAAQAALILGTPRDQVAVQYGISLSTIEVWENTLLTVEAIGRRDRLSAMLMSFIDQEMKSLMAISIVTSTEDWIERQSASELSNFIAVKTDRLLLLLQAFGRVETARFQYTQQLEVMNSDD